jgi:HSP20 family protein
MTMSDFKKELFEDVRQIQEEMDLLFNQLSHWRKASAANRLWRPSSDVWENDAEVVAVIELAGVRPADVSITLTNGILTVRGERSPRQLREGCTFRNLEIPTGRFERLIHLPETINPEQVHAAYKDGLLEIRVAKIAAAPGTSREIAITGE